MANTIKLKSSAVAGKVPTTSDLALRELAVNTTDGKLFIKKSVGGVESIVEIGAGGSTSSFLRSDADDEATGVIDFLGGSAGTPAIRIRSGGNSWSEGLAIHPSANSGYALTFFRTRASLSDSTNTWAIGNLGEGGTNNFGLLRFGLTGGSGIRVDSVFDVTQAGVFRFGFTPTVGSSTIWHAGNDGVGSGLDADLLDGLNSASFVRSDADTTLSGNYTFSGTSLSSRLSMTGHGGAANYNYFLNAFNDTGLKAVHFVNGSTRSADGGGNTYTIRNDGGSLRLGNSSFPTLLEGNALTYNSNTVWHAGNDGAGSGLDADLLDGLSSGSFIQTPGSSSQMISGNSGGPVDPNNVTINGIQYANSVSLFGQTDGALYSQAYNSSWIGQIFQDYRTGQLALRGKNNGTWQAWRTNWDSGNDGAGSGLDADLLDGLNSDRFLRSSGFPGYGNWNDFGNAQQTVYEVYQENFNIGSNTGSTNFPTNRAYAYGALINFGANSNARAQVYISHAGNDLIFRGGWGTSGWNTWNRVWTDVNDGAGSGLDADLLDGLNSSQFLRSDVSTTNSVDIRAPIFYDSNNTAYYVDPNSTSVIKYLKVNTDGTSSGTRALTIKQDGQGEINFGSYPGSWTSALQIQNNNNTDIVWLSPLDDGTNARFRTGGCGLDFYTDGIATDTGTYSLFVGSGSARSPIFYDLDNTSFYLDPASTSLLNILSFGNVTRQMINLWGTQYGLGVQSSTLYYRSDSRFSWHRGGSHNDSENNPGGGTVAMTLDSSSNLTVTTSCRAPIFYDSNDTAYYVDGNSESRLYRVRVGPYAGSTSSGNQTGLELINTGGTGDGNVAAISFHCAGYYGMHMHLRADNYFGIGGWSASTWRWYVQMSTGDMTAAGNVTAYSDIRLKEEITPLENSLDKLMTLNGVSFRWKNLPDIVGHPGEKDFGIIAQEVEKVFPEVIHESAHESPDGDKYKTVAYDKLVPVLLEAIKELKAEVDSLKLKLAS